MNISVIITVYNCAQYLDRCFESIKNQTYDIYEIIIVDDGSQDMSAQLCDEFACSRDNVKVLHKTNGGTVSARKAGLMASNGELVCFIDGDDWVDKNFCGELIKPFICNDELDVVSSGLRFEYISEPEKNRDVFDGAEAGLWHDKERESYLLRNLFYDLEKGTSALTASICCKMLKREIALSAMSDMDEHLTLGEDGAYVLSVLVKAKSVFVLKEAYYHYEQHVGSQNYKFNFGTYKQVKRLQQCMETIVLNAGKAQIMQSQIEYYIKEALCRIEKSIFNIDVDGMIYLFPVDRIEQGSKVVIHGAGKVGKQYVKYITRTKKYELVGWTDKKVAYEFMAVNTVCAISEITKMDYDYIILASNEEFILEEMKRDILHYNVEKEKVLADRPLSYRI